MIELVGDELYQWDVGRKVKITPKRGYTISCVHFNDGSDDSLTMVNGVATARIPDELLQQCGSVTVYAVSTKEGGIETTESRQFYIKKKTKPTGYTHVPTEVATINSAISAATQAKASAEEAKGYRDEAGNYATNASNSATKASTSEGNANTYKVAAENAKNEILGSGGTYSNPKDNSALKEIRSAKKEIVGATGTATLPNDKSALEEIRNTKTEIIGATGTYANPNNKSALKEIRDFTATNGPLAQAKDAAQAAADSKDAIKSIESNMNTAVEAAGQIDSFRSEITKSHDETINARDEILGSGDDTSYIKPADNSALKEIRDAKKIIVGDSETASAKNPDKESALKKAQEAQAAAEKARDEAEGFAESANQGITVINDLNNDSATDALSAQKGKELKDNKLDKSGGTMTGTLVLSGDPSASNDAATKNYVDTHMPSLVTTTNDGVMSKEDKVKLDGLENALAAKVDKEDGKGLSTNDFTTDEKTKLAGLENYTLPTASDTVKGGIKVGAGLTMNGEVLSATGGGTADAVDWSNVTNKPETFAPSTHTHTASEVTELATVATSGSYNDLSDKPTDFAPAAHTHEMTDIIGLSDALDGKSDTTHNHDGTYLKSVPIATETTLGGIKVGDNLSITEDGTLSANAQKMTVDSTLDSNSVNPVQNKVVKNALDSHNHDGTYLKEVPEATSTTLGGIKVGTGLSVTADGTLSADAYTQLAGLKFVVSDKAPTSADDKTFTIVVPN